MRLLALFAATRAESYGADTQAVIRALQAAINDHLAQRYPGSTLAFGSLRAMLLKCPRALGTDKIDGVEQALNTHATQDVVRDWFDLCTGWILDGGVPEHLLRHFAKYVPHLTSLKTFGSTLRNQIQFGATHLVLDQNLIEPSAALAGIRAWIQEKLNDSLGSRILPHGIGVMSWAIFELNTRKRAKSALDGRYIEYFLEPDIDPSELGDLSSELLIKATADFEEFDADGFEHWLLQDFLMDSLVFNPALACCLRGIPTRQIIQRLTPMITLLNCRRSHEPNSAMTEQSDVRQGLINALALFPSRLAQINATPREMAGLSAAPHFTMDVSTAKSSRLNSSPIDALQLNGLQQEHLIKTLRRLEGWGLQPDPELAAQAVLQGLADSTVMLLSKNRQQTLGAVESFFRQVDTGSVSETDHTAFREVISALHLPAYSEIARLNMALIVLTRAIDIFVSRQRRGMKQNNLVLLTFKSPKELVEDWDRAYDVMLNTLVQKQALQHKLMLWAGFDSRVLSKLEHLAPSKLRDDFMAQDLGL